MREVAPAMVCSHHRGAERQRGRRREDRICVRPPSLVGRREMMSPRMPSGRRLMKSCSSRFLFLALVSTPMAMAAAGGGEEINGGRKPRQ
nr:unnamed protein product [Digitaria exilis]